LVLPVLNLETFHIRIDVLIFGVPIFASIGGPAVAENINHPVEIFALVSLPECLDVTVVNIIVRHRILIDESSNLNF
jgi:hypothetical protein